MEDSIDNSRTRASVSNEHYLSWMVKESGGDEKVRLLQRKELREAIKRKRKLVLLHEQDTRFNAIDFTKEKSNAPDGEYNNTPPPHTNSDSHKF